MSDLISRSELIENFRKCYSGHLGMENSDACMTFHGICNVINNTNTDYDVDKVVEELKEAKHEICLSDEDLEHYQNGIDDAIEIVKQGGVSDDVCEWKVFDNSLIDEPQWVYGTTCGKYVGEEHTSKAFAYCPYCGKKIKVVE